MKKSLLVIFAFLCTTLLGFSQGIVFEHITWKAMLEKAKKTDKPIFIDVYTSWCVPCKKMKEGAFTLENVGNVYNSSFICYQVDAEKGDGIEIASKYEVKSFLLISSLDLME